ncbi:MAG: acyltransferase [Phycisphaerales bacterium JB058]
MGEIKDGVVSEKGSALKKYQSAIIGSSSMLLLVRYELTQLFLTRLPGALGLLLRQKLARGLLGSCGGKPAFGTDVIFRHPKRIRLGSTVVIDDSCCFDAYTEGDVGIAVGDRCMFGRGTRLSSKQGKISIGDDCGFGAGITVHAAVGGEVSIGNKCIIAGHTYIGGGQYHMDRTDLPIVDQGHVRGLRLVIEDNCWIGANAVIVNGVTVGHDAVVAAGAVVTKDVPPFAVVAGVPAKVIRMRDASEPKEQALATG